mgnify:CR=1 FL=1
MAREARRKNQRVTTGNVTNLPVLLYKKKRPLSPPQARKFTDSTPQISAKTRFPVILHPKSLKKIGLPAWKMRYGLHMNPTARFERPDRDSGEQIMSFFWKIRYFPLFQIKISPRKNNIFHPVFFSRSDLLLNRSFPGSFYYSDNFWYPLWPYLEKSKNSF